MFVNFIEKIRCFVAVDLPREAISQIKEIQKKIKKHNLFIGKFTESENLHLTLKFLGEIEEDKIEKVKEKLEEIQFEEFDAKLGEIGIFSKKFIKIIWIKLDGKKILDLQKQMDDALKDLFVPEARFMSHVTIARVKNVKDRNALIEYIKRIKSKSAEFKIEEFFLKKSTLMPEGPIYEDILKIELKSSEDKKDK